jgi:IclR family transcriptional regulator, pca regulon regulatory protein
MAADPDRNFINSLSKGLTLLMSFSKKQPKMSLTEIARANDMNLPTARRYLHTLTTLGFMVKDNSTQTFQITAKVLRLGSYVLETMEIKQRLMPFLRAINKSFNVTTHCTILEGTEAVTIERLRSSDVVNLDITTGSRLPIYCTSSGKAILAFLPSREQSRICSQIDFKRFTPHTITDLNLLVNELEKTQKRGYAIAVQELSLGLKTMAVPIFDLNGNVVASFGVSYPITRAQESGLEDLLIKKLIEVKNAA